MEELDFIIDESEGLRPAAVDEATGWESVVFVVADLEEAE